MQTLEEHLAMHWQVKGGGNKTWICVFYDKRFVVYIWWFHWYRLVFGGLIWSKRTNVIFEEGGTGFIVAGRKENGKGSWWRQMWGSMSSTEGPGVVWRMLRVPEDTGCVHSKRPDKDMSLLYLISLLTSAFYLIIFLELSHTYSSM